MKTNMTKVGFFSLFQILSFAAMMQASSLPYHNGPEMTRTAELTFFENKCELKDHTGKTNKKVLFLAQTDNTKFLFRKDGITLQNTPSVASEKETNSNNNMVQGNNTIQKMDIFWEGMNKDADIYGAEEINARVLRHINGLSSKECENKNFRKLYYAEIYPGIDLRYYDRNSHLKYDMIVHPGFNFSDIKMRIEGATDLSVNENGQLLIKTENSEITEDAPLVQQDGKPLTAKWIITDNIVSLEIKNHNPEKELCVQSSLRNTGSAVNKI